MFKSNKDNRLANLTEKFFAENNQFEKTFITELLKLDYKEWEAVGNFINKLQIY